MTNHPNRSRRSDAPARSPAPDEIRALRERHELTQSGAAALVYTTLNGFQKWEQGERAMHAGLWELLRIKLGEINVKGAPNARDRPSA